MKSNNVHLCVKKPQVISSLSTFLHTKSRRTHCFREAGFLWNDVPTSFPLRYFCQLEFDRFYLGKREIHGVHLSIPTCAQRLKITQKSLILQYCESQILMYFRCLEFLSIQVRHFLWFLNTVLVMGKCIWSRSSTWGICSSSFEKVP